VVVIPSIKLDSVLVHYQRFHGNVKFSA